MREHTFPDDEGWSRLGLVLWKMGESTMAQQIYGALLKQATKDSAKAPIYEALGLMMKRAQGEYAEALAYYKKSIEIKEKQIPRNNLSLAMSYNNSGNVYYSINDYRKALSFYQKDLEISEKSLFPTHPSLANTHYNIGLLHEKMGNYSRAQSSFQRAVDIAKSSLPLNHPDLGEYQNNLTRIKKKLN